MFDHEDGQVVLDPNTWIKIRVEPVQDHCRGTFILFSLKLEEGKVKRPEVNSDYHNDSVDEDSENFDEDEDSDSENDDSVDNDDIQGIPKLL
jgi:hypothetical protein